MTHTPPAPAAAYLVRHGAMRFIGAFEPPAGVTLGRRETVILRSDRGLEVGEVLCPATPQAVAAVPEPTRGQVVRVATDDDRRKIIALKDVQAREYTIGTDLIARHKLAMQLVDVEHLFGGERI